MTVESAGFVDDVRPDGMLYGAVVRTRPRRGMIVDLRVPEVPPGYHVLRKSDIPGNPTIQIAGTELPVMVDREIRYRGQALALVAGPEQRTVGAIADAVDVQYEREEPVLLEPPYDRLAVSAQRTVVHGRPDERFAEAFQIIEGEYITDPRNGQSLEPVGALAVPTDTDDHMRIIVASKWIYNVRTSVARVLDMDPDHVDIHCAEDGAGGDGFLWNPTLIACQAALLAAESRRPVRIMMSSAQRRSLCSVRGSVRVYNKTALDKDGNVLAMDVTIRADTGAYPILAKELVDRLTLSSADTYVCRHMRIHTVGYTTDSIPTESYVAYGHAAANFAMEVHATRLAELAQDDPSQWRRRNLMAETAQTFTGAPADTDRARDLLARVVERADFQRKYAAYEMLRKRRGVISPLETSLRGIGVACARIGSGFIGGDDVDPCTVSARMDAQGRLFIATSLPLQDTGSLNPVRETATEILGLAPHDFQIVPPATSITPNSGPGIFSKNVTVIRRLVQLCCASLQKKRFRSPLPLEVRRSYRKPGKRQWDREAFSGTPFQPLSWAATVVEVELHPVTLEISLRGIWMDVDPNQLLDPLGAERAVEAEIADAYDWCRTRESRWEEAGARAFYSAAQFTRTIPPVSIRLHPGAGDRPGPVEGLATSGFLPAFVSAVSQASGFYFDTVPLTSALLHQYVEL